VLYYQDFFEVNVNDDGFFFFLDFFCLWKGNGLVVVIFGNK